MNVFTGGGLAVTLRGGSPARGSALGGRQEARRSFFSVRLWDQDALISAVLEDYERLGEALRVDLPLKQVWVLASQREADETESI